VASCSLAIFLAPAVRGHDVCPRFRPWSWSLAPWRPAIKRHCGTLDFYFHSRRTTKQNDNSAGYGEYRQRGTPIDVSEPPPRMTQTALFRPPSSQLADGPSTTLGLKHTRAHPVYRSRRPMMSLDLAVMHSYPDCALSLAVEKFNETMLATITGPCACKMTAFLLSVLFLFGRTTNKRR
jgi:hypothetical protein